MKKLLAYPLTLVFAIFFFACLLIFHAIQWLSLKLGGYEAHKTSVDVFNLAIMRCLNILGTRFSFDNPHTISADRPCIFVANHQGMFDIPPLIWFLRKHHPKFISKIELGKGIPGISFNLRHGGAALIDRKNPKQAIATLAAFAGELKRTGHSAVIFPEGTRSRTGQPKKFAISGLQLLIKKMPDALIVPVTINNSWKLFRYGTFPLDVGVHLKVKIHEPITSTGEDTEELINRVEQTIIKDIQ